MTKDKKRGAVILCGGQSTRMGEDKATLPFGPEAMLQRVVRLVGEAVDGPIAVVASKQQQLPDLPENTILAHDRRENRGPLEGLAAGLSAISDQVDTVFATACDVPLLVPTFVTKMFELLDNHEIVVPRDGKFYHPLAAVYRTSVLAQVETLLSEDRLRPFFLFAESDTLEVAIDALREVDPELDTLENLNHREDYLKALRRAGF